MGGSPELAGRDDLGPDEEWEWVDLPKLGKRVKVRYAATSDVAYLSNLPDMLQFADAARRIRELEEHEDEEARRKAEKAMASFTGENTAWRERLAHVVVMAPDAGPEVFECAECGWRHPRALWSVHQTGRLHGDDLNLISERTLSPRSFEGVRPFSPEETPDGSLGPAGTSESTPQTSSA
jgi:hypothetical protein